MILKGISEGFKDVDVKQGIVCGYFSHFGTKDSDGDIILPGAYTKTISENGPGSKNPRIKHLLDHDKKKAVAVIQVLKEDSIGLYYESKAGTHQNGVDFLRMVESGIITEHSVGFETIKEQQKADGNYMSELRLWEGSSLQAWGSNHNTPITGMKAMEIAEKMGLLIKEIRNGQYSDEAIISLKAQLEELTKAFEVLAAPVKEAEPVQPTPSELNPDLKAIEILTQFKKSFSF
jgi:HK97 family phage prohead protease